MRPALKTVEKRWMKANIKVGRKIYRLRPRVGYVVGMWFRRLPGLLAVLVLLLCLVSFIALLGISHGISSNSPTDSNLRSSIGLNDWKTELTNAVGDSHVF